jgi:hypothetical protein
VQLLFKFDPRRFAAESMERLLGEFAALLTAFTAQPDATLAELMAPLVAAERARQAEGEAQFKSSRQQQLSQLRRRPRS